MGSIMTREMGQLALLRRVTQLFAPKSIRLL